MTEVSVGALFGTVELTTVSFDRGYARVVAAMSDLGERSAATTTETGRLDAGLTAVSSSATKASVAVSRAAKSAAEIAAADQKAAASAERHAAAEDQLAVVMGDISEMSVREQRAVLGLLAAHENLSRVEGSQTATLMSLARAQAAVIGADDRLTAAQNAAAAAAEREAAAMRAAAASSVAAAASTGAATGRFAGLAKTAAELGLVIGGIELVKKGAEFVMAGKDLTSSLNSVQAAAHATDAAMVPVRAQVIGLGHDLTVPRATAVDAAAAIDDLVRSGMTLPRAMAAARSALLLASVSQTDMALTARVLGDALDEFQLPASQAAHVATLLGAAATSTAGGLETVFDALRYAGTRARAAKIPMNDLLASIVDLSKAGLQGTTIGTGLAMMISRLSHESAPGAKALADLGINAWDAQGRFKGLPFVIDAVSQAGKRFGPNSHQFLADLTVAFGARAANIMAAFAGKGIEGVDRFENRLNSFNLQDAANKMNRGFGAAMGQIEKQLTALGIDFYQKVEPALSSAAMWLGTSVPHAITVLAQILGPIIHLVGVGLVGAWHAAIAILGPVASMLGSVGHFLADNADAVRDATGLVLGLWVAYKGYTIAVGAYRALTTAALTYRAAMISTNVAAPGMASNLARFVTAGGPAALAIGAVAVAVGVLGFKISGWIEGGRSSVAVMFSLAGAVKSWKSALDAANGALDQNVAKSVAVQLQSDGLAKKAAAAGISLNDLTYGVTHGRDAFDQLVASWKAGGKPSDDTITAARMLAAEFYGTQRSALGLASVTGKLSAPLQLSATAMEHNADAAKAAASAHTAVAAATGLVLDTSGNFVRSNASVAKAADAATTALDAQTTASKNLKLAEDLLNGVNEALETSTDAFTIAVQNLAHKQGLATDANGNATASLSKNTAAGATNRQMLVGLIDAAKTQAQATADQAAKHHTLAQALVIGNNRLATNETAIRAAAKAAGMDKGATDDLINSLGILSKVHPDPKVDVNITPAQAKANAIQAQIDSFRQHHQPELKVDPTDALHVIGDIANGIANLHDKDIYVDVHQRVLGAPIPHATGGYGGPMLSAARTAYGMINGPGTGTSDQAGIYKLSAKEFVSTAASVARNAGALEAGNRGATLVAIDGMTRKLIASSARASVPVRAPMAVAAPSGAGMDVTALRNELSEIRRLLAAAPERTGAAVGAATLDGYREAGSAFARQSLRDWRGR